MMIDKTLAVLKKEILPKIEEEMMLREKAKKKCSSMEKALSEQRRMVDSLEIEINKLNLAAGDSLAGEGDFKKIQKSIINKEIEQNSCREWHTRIKEELLPPIRVALAKSEEALKQKVILALGPVKDNAEVEMDSKIESAMNVLDDYIDAVNLFYGELGLLRTAGTESEFPRFIRVNERLNIYVTNVLGR